MTIDNFVSRTCPENRSSVLKQKSISKFLECGMWMRLLKATKTEKGDDDHYFCVSDDEGEKDWLSDIPAAGSPRWKAPESRSGALRT